MDLRLTARLIDTEQEHNFILAQLYPVSYDFFNSIEVEDGSPIDFAIDLVCEEAGSVIDTIFAPKGTVERVFSTKIATPIQVVSNDASPEDSQASALDYICSQLAASNHSFKCSVDTSNMSLLYSAGSHRYLTGKFSMGVIVQLAGGWRIIQQITHEISYLPLSGDAVAMNGQLFVRNGSNIQISEDALIVRLDELKGGEVMTKIPAKALMDCEGYAHLARCKDAQAIINTLDTVFIHKGSNGYFGGSSKATCMNDDLPLDERFIEAGNEALREHLMGFFAGVAG